MSDGWEATVGRVLILGLLGAIGLCVAEVFLIAQILRVAGFFLTVTLVLLTTILGVFMLGRVGTLGPRRFRAILEEGGAPGRAMADGLLGLVAALLLVVPGFLTDAMGLVLLVAPIRAVAADTTARLVERRVGSMVGTDPLSRRWQAAARGSNQRCGAANDFRDTGASTVIEGEVVDDPGGADR